MSLAAVRACSAASDVAVPLLRTSLAVPGMFPAAAPTPSPNIARLEGLAKSLGTPLVTIDVIESRSLADAYTCPPHRANCSLLRGGTSTTAQMTEVVSVGTCITAPRLRHSLSSTSSRARRTFIFGIACAASSAAGYPSASIGYPEHVHGLDEHVDSSQSPELEVTGSDRLVPVEFKSDGHFALNKEPKTIVPTTATGPTLRNASLVDNEKLAELDRSIVQERSIVDEKLAELEARFGEPEQRLRHRLAKMAAIATQPAAAAQPGGPPPSPPSASEMESREEDLQRELEELLAQLRKMPDLPTADLPALPQVPDVPDELFDPDQSLSFHGHLSPSPPQPSPPTRLRGSGCKCALRSVALLPGRW